MNTTPLYIGSDIYRKAAFGRNHPLSIPRVERVREMCVALGWMGADQYCNSPIASDLQLAQFQAADYLQALRDAERCGRVPRAVRERYGFGTAENPLFPGLYERAACSVGGSIYAAQRALEGRAVFHPAGGTHHAWPDRARGFCYFNDPVFAILEFLDAGLERVLYVDLDAHHGDGVQRAFETEARVRTVSMHETGRWPGTGPAEDVGLGYACNIPVPSQFNDSELERVSAEILLPIAQGFSPQAIVVTCGADACRGDPLSTMALSNGALWSVVGQVLAFAPSAVVVGGGGYNPWTLIRYWAGLWGMLTDQRIPERLSGEASEVFAGLHCDLIDDEDIDPNWVQALKDPPNHGMVREQTTDTINRVQSAMVQSNWRTETSDFMEKTL